MPRHSDTATTIVQGTLLLTAALLLSPSPASGQACATPQEAVAIEDAGLTQAIKKQLGLSTAEVTCGDMAKLRELSARDASIASLRGLESATELRRLDCSRNRISDLAPLSELKQLNELLLERNLVADLGPLLRNTQVGAGVRINVTLNCLELSAGSEDRQAVETLMKRGVDVEFRQQKNPADCVKKAVETGSPVATDLQHGVGLFPFQ
jgi:Leucine-rich repeat (LRR) protein